MKEISSFKRREIARELGKEGPNNYAIMFKGKKTFWKVVRSKKLADKIVATLKRRGKDAKVVLTAAPVTEIAKRKVLPDLDPFAGSIKRYTKGRQPKKLSKVDQRFTSGLVTKYTKGRQPAKESTKDTTISEKRIAGLEKKSKESGIPYGILKKVFDRGMAAWKSGHRPGATPHQWAFARVNSFIVGGKTRKTADADLWRKYKGESVNEEKEEAVYPHKMYDPKTGKAYIAKTPEDHERMTKLGYTHDDPNTPEKEEGVKVRKNKTGMMGSKTQVHKDKKKELSKTAARKKVSVDESRLIKMVECVIGNVDTKFQIAESITLDSKPSEIKEIYKKLYGKNDKGRSGQT